MTAVAARNNQHYGTINKREDNDRFPGLYVGMLKDDCTEKFKQLNGTEFKVYYCLHQLRDVKSVNAEGYFLGWTVFVRQETIAEKCGISLRSAQRALSKLEEKDFILVKRPKSGFGCHRYRINAFCQAIARKAEETGESSDTNEREKVVVMPEPSKRPSRQKPRHRRRQRPTTPNPRPEPQPKKAAEVQTESVEAISQPVDESAEPVDEFTEASATESVNQSEGETSITAFSQETSNATPENTQNPCDNRDAPIRQQCRMDTPSVSHPYAKFGVHKRIGLKEQNVKDQPPPISPSVELLLNRWIDKKGRVQVEVGEERLCEWMQEGIQIVGQAHRLTEPEATTVLANLFEYQVSPTVKYPVYFWKTHDGEVRLNDAVAGFKRRKRQHEENPSHFSSPVHPFFDSSNHPSANDDRDETYNERSKVSVSGAAARGSGEAADGTADFAHTAAHEAAHMAADGSEMALEVADASHGADTIAQTGKEALRDDVSPTLTSDVEARWQPYIWRVFQSRGLTPETTDERIRFLFRREIRADGEVFEAYLMGQWQEYQKGIEKRRERIDEQLGKTGEQASLQCTHESTSEPLSVDPSTCQPAVETTTHQLSAENPTTQSASTGWSTLGEALPRIRRKG